MPSSLHWNGDFELILFLSRPVQGHNGSIRFLKMDANLEMSNAEIVKHRETSSSPLLPSPWFSARTGGKYTSTKYSSLPTPSPERIGPLRNPGWHEINIRVPWDAGGYSIPLKSESKMPGMSNTHLRSIAEIDNTGQPIDQRAESPWTSEDHNRPGLTRTDRSETWQEQSKKHSELIP